VVNAVRQDELRRLFQPDETMQGYHDRNRKPCNDKIRAEEEPQFPLTYFCSQKKATRNYVDQRIGTSNGQSDG
jgi:hypothetical protein